MMINSIPSILLSFMLMQLLLQACSATLCPSLTPTINATGFGSFDTVHLRPRCPQGPSESTQMPDKVNWIVSAVQDTLLSVSMTPPNVFTPVVQNRELSFYFVPTNWPGRGEIGVEVQFPAGTVQYIDVSGNNNKAQIINLTQPITVEVLSNASTAYITSFSTVTLVVNGSNTSVEASALNFVDFHVDGDANDIKLKGIMSSTNGLVGDNNNILIDSSSAVSAAQTTAPSGMEPVNITGTGNTIKLNNGNCYEVDNAVGSSPGVNTCSESNETVTVGSIPCTVEASSILVDRCSDAFSITFAASSFFGMFGPLVAGTVVYMAVMTLL